MAYVVSEKPLLDNSTKTFSEKTAQRFFEVYEDNGVNYGEVMKGIIAVDLVESVAGITINSPHPEDRELVVVGMVGSMNGRIDRALVKVDYGTPSGAVLSPLDADPITWIETSESDEEYYQDNTTGTPKRCILTNGKPLNPLPKRQRIDYRIFREQNVDSSFRPNFAAYNNHVNSDSVTTFGFTFTAGQIRVIQRLSKPQTTNGFEFRVYTKELLISDLGWQQKIESRDKEELQSGTFLVPIQDYYNRPVDFPWPLQTDGTKGAALSTAPAIISLKTYKEAALNTFVNSSTI